MRKVIFFISLFLVVGIWGFFWWDKMHTIEKIIIVDDGEEKNILNVRQGTICDALNEIGIEIMEYDKVSPNCDNYIENEIKIIIKRRKKITITQGDEKKEIEIFGKKELKDVFLENDIKYDDNDIISKELNFLLEKDEEIEIINVENKVVTQKQAIKFDKKTKKDSAKEIGYKKVVQKGILGEKEFVYNAALHNGKEFDRTLDSETVIKKPVDEITILGTKKVYKLGKSHEGKASWYANKDCDCAANQWLPFGSKVKVTNKANGKSVIVEINDRGPFVDGRIIDLDKVAFKKIASIGAGVIDVKMEEIEE